MWSIFINQYEDEIETKEMVKHIIQKLITLSKASSASLCIKLDW